MKENNAFCWYRGLKTEKYDPVLSPFPESWYSEMWIGSPLIAIKSKILFGIFVQQRSEKNSIQSVMVQIFLLIGKIFCESMYAYKMRNISTWITVPIISLSYFNLIFFKNISNLLMQFYIPILFRLILDGDLFRWWFGRCTGLCILQRSEKEQVRPFKSSKRRIHKC